MGGIPDFDRRTMVKILKEISREKSTDKYDSYAQAELLRRIFMGLIERIQTLETAVQGLS